MNILIFFIITNLFLISSTVPFLSESDAIALNDMHTEWGNTLQWTGGIINACNWYGISCATDYVIRMFVVINLFINC